jgi:hypothetical protein
VVSSCRRCNHVKADRPLGDLGWRMKRPPVQPNGSAWRILSSGRTDQRWLPYLRGYGADVDLLPFEAKGPDGLFVSEDLPEHVTVERNEHVAQVVKPGILPSISPLAA